MDNATNSSDYEKKLKTFEATADLQRETETLSEKSRYYKAYALSFFLPPIGLYYFVKFFFFDGGSDGGRKAAVISLVVTVISVLLNYWLFNILFTSTLNSVVPGGAGGTLKELITPANQKSLYDLYK